MTAPAARGLAVATAIAFAALFTSPASARGDEAAPRPNVLFVLADDLGYGDLSCYGQRRFTTPRLDELASRGLRFTQHYSGSTVCAPSRCALLTGKHTGRCAVRGNRTIGDEGQYPLPAEEITFAEALREAGYATAAFGKWGLGHPDTPGGPLRQGFDHFFGYNCQAHAHRYYTGHLWEDGRRISVERSQYTHDLIVDRATAFLREHLARRDGRPFFLYLPVTIPHAAMEVPADDHAPFRERFPQFEETVGRYGGAETKNPVAAFAGMVTRLDRDIGRLVDLLEESGQAERTLIVFTSDNGPHLEGGHDPAFFDSNGPLRGHKRDLYEGGVRAPTLAVWPGHIAAGSETDLLSAHWDWLPTLCDLAGVGPPSGIDGISLAPTLTGHGEQRQHETLYWEFHERGGKQAIRHGPWKAIRLGVAANPAATPELYHLPSDPGETKNLAASKPQVLAELIALMDAERTPTDVWTFGRR